MEEQITPFNDYPIEFKELNPEDFDTFNVNEKIIITPNDQGYINEELQREINLEAKNTVVVNAGVGQGKTYSIIQIVKKYYDLDNYVVFIASPYMSLVQQYYDKIIECNITEDQIYRYENIGVNDIDPRRSKVQILTVNALLGNPGEDSIINSQAKRDYINTMVTYCEENNKKAVFIYDEIHDAIHNFKEEYIFTLWKWRNVIHKNLIISATFNEASKVVIQYLANLTDKNIQLIESMRVRIVEKQSELYLHYNDKNRYFYNDEGITSIVESLISRQKNIDILCYSKKLATDICDLNNADGIGELLRRNGIEIQECTSGLIENERPDRSVPTNRYNPLKTNVGTNYKTGISIEKENHAFVIIMPPKKDKNSFKKYYGIFSDGLNAIIQALARQRKKGEIHVILPSPDTIDYSTLPFTDEDKRMVFKQFYSNGEETTQSNNNTIRYSGINSEKSRLLDYYTNVYRKNVEDEIDFLDTQIEGQYAPRIEFPSLENFILNHGEKYLTNTYFEGNLSAIVTYYSITNQFTNCRLVKIEGKSKITFNQENLVEDLTRFYYNTVESDYFHNTLYYNTLYDFDCLSSIWSTEITREEINFSDNANIADKELYKYLREALFDHFTVYMQRLNRPKVTIECDSHNKYFEQALLTIFHNYRNSSFYNIIRENGTQSYTRADYFRANILHAMALTEKIDAELIEVEEDTKELVNAYMSMKYFISKIRIDRTTIREVGTVEYLLNNPHDLFITSEDSTRFYSMITILLEKDYFIYNKIFDFKNSFDRVDYSEEQKINYFYKCLMNDFFSTYKKEINRADMPRILYIISSRFSSEEENLLDYPNFLLLFE